MQNRNIRIFSFYWSVVENVQSAFMTCFSTFCVLKYISMYSTMYTCSMWKQCLSCGYLKCVCRQKERSEAVSLCWSPWQTFLGERPDGLLWRHAPEIDRGKNWLLLLLLLLLLFLLFKPRTTGIVLFYHTTPVVRRGPPQSLSVEPVHNYGDRAMTTHACRKN